MELKSLKKLEDRLKYIRMQLDLSQADLADMAGTTQQAIQQAETGKARNPRYLPQLAQALGVPHGWLALNIFEEHKETKALLSAQESDVLSSFKSMPKKDQDLMLELMKSRSKK